MPRFLAVYTMKAESLARFRQMPKTEQEAVDAAGLPQWVAWEVRHAASIVDRGGMVGRTRRVTKDGLAEVANDLCGYVVVEAESLDDAARLFENHPHFAIFPGDAVDVMPFVTG